MFPEKSLCLVACSFIPSIYLRLILQNLCEGAARSKVL